MKIIETYFIISADFIGLLLKLENGKYFTQNLASYMNLPDLEYKEITESEAQKMIIETKNKMK